MATVLGLAMKITADASGLTKSLTPVDRALQSLGQQADKSAQLFESFKTSTTGAADAQASVQKAFADLTNSLQSGAINAEEFAQRFSEIQQSARETADAFARGAAITEEAKTAEEKRAEQLADLNRLLELGAISQETFDRAASEASGANAAAADAEKARASAIADANRIIQANLTPQEKYDAELQNLREHLDEGRLSQDQFNRASAKAKKSLDDSSDSAKKTDKSLEGVSKQLRLISTIEIGRAIVDSFQVLTNAARNVVNQITSVVSNVSQSLDALNDLSNRIDVPVEKLQSLGLAAKLAGVDAEQFATAVTKLGVTVGKADPGGAFDKTLQSIGVSLQEIRGLSPEEQFAQIAEAIGGLPTAADQAAAAVEVFGKQGAALVPLFRDGAASVDELAKRAERLGIIVGEDQVSNIADMNDAFDLVRATVEGIIGQVTGNLAPVVTAVANDFLRFVESFQTLDGRGGGSGIADVITNTLADGFQSFIGILKSVGNSIISFGEAVSTVIERVQSLLGIESESSATRRARELEDQIYALENSMDFVTRAFTGATQEQQEQELRDLQKALALAKAKAEQESAASIANQLRQSLNAGLDAVAQSLETATEQLDQRLSPQFQIETNAEEVRNKFDKLFNGIVDQASEATRLMREFEAAIAAAQEDGELTAEEIANINQLQQQVNVAITRELNLRTEAQEKAKAQAESDAKRIDALLQVSDAASKIEEDILAVRREQQRLAESLAAGGGDATAQQQRLAELEQLEARLSEQQQAIEQGFGQGFQAAFDSVTNDVNNLIDRAAQFGNEGALAAQRLQEGIAAAQEQARDGILNAEAFDAEVKRQQQLFDQQIEQLQRVADERKRVNEFVDQQLLLAQFGGDQQRLEAANRVAEIQREIIRIERDVQAARVDGNLEAANAGKQRLELLNQVGAREADIASGRQQLEEQIAKTREEAQERALKAREEVEKALAEAQQKILEEERKAAEEEAQRQAERIRQLNTLGAQTIQAGDIRTAEGAALVQQLAAEAQDPALIEQRRQTKLLQQISAGITGAAANYFDSPVEIVGFARIGGFA